MNTRNLIIGLVVLVLLIGGFMTLGGGTNMLAPKPTPTPITALVDYENLVTASGILVPVKRATLAMRAAGQITQIPVKVGDQVKAGDVLVRLDDAEAQAAVKLAQAALAQLKAGASKEEIAIAQANLANAQAQLAKVRAGATPEDIAMAKASLDRAAALLKNAQAEYDKVKNDPYIGMMPQSAALESAYEQYRIAEAQYNRAVKGATAEDIRIAETAVAVAQANLSRVQAGARPEEIAAAQARLDQAQAALNLMTLTAPFAGTIASINAREGETILPGAPLVVLGDLSKLRLETDDLSETSIARVKIGQIVNVTFEALPKQSFKGKVIEIAPIASAKQGGTNYTVYIDLENLDAALRWGMTGHIEIDTKQ
jgi:HlyD family secretion protein